MTGRPLAVHGACVRGVEAVPVTVEVSLAGGIPGISVVGMADTSVLEARQRIRCALRSAGFKLPRQSITVNLAPSDMRKTGTGLDLPICIAILAASGQIPSDGIEGALFVGELGLDGTLAPVRGEIAYEILARDAGLTFIGPPRANHVDLEGVRSRALADIGDLVHGLDRACVAFPVSPTHPVPRERTGDYGDVVGQELAKRALAIAAAGGLGIAMVGPPGSGKTMLARRMTTILPPIEERQRQEALCIHSVAGEPLGRILAGERPFRDPHHSSTPAGLIGGGRPVRPGEISLAHGGVLFLDELAEFSSHALQMLRQPLEEGCVRIVRADGVYRFPASFQLVAASNPCPCGYLGDPDVACRCTPGAIERYRTRLGGPLADRIDIMVEVARPDPRAVLQGAEGLTSEVLAQSVVRGRAFRAWRAARDETRHATASSFDGVMRSFALDSDARALALDIAHREHLTARGITRLCRVARTVADMDEDLNVGTGHVLEASQIRGRRQL